MSIFPPRASHIDHVAVATGRRLGLVGLVVVLLVGGSAGAWAWWSSTGAGTGTAMTGTLNAPQQVTATSRVGSRDVNVGWAVPDSGQAPTGYFVKRLGSSGAVPACDSSPTGTLPMTSCVDKGVADGSYTYVVTAVFNSWTAVSEPSQEVTVLGAAPTSTTLTSSANPSVVGQTVTYTATVSAQSGGGTPSGSVSFTDADVPITCSNSAGQTLNGAGVATCQVTYAGPGNHSVKGVYAGAAGFAGSTSNGLAQVVGKAATSTALTSSANPSKSGQQVTYTATVSVTLPGSAIPTGSVDFKEGSTTICANRPVSSGSATCLVSYPSVSSHAVAATYSGDTNLLGSPSATLNQSVDKAATSTSLASSTNPAVTGQQITYTATVAVTGPGAGTPTGSVTFMNGTQTISCSGGAQILNASGIATCTTSLTTAGAVSIGATYAGDGNFSGSTSNVVAQTVNKASTATTLATSVNPANAGQSVTLTASVAAVQPGAGTQVGTVQFLANGTAISGCSAQSLTGGQATCATTFPTPGARTLTAVYSGSNDFNGSTSNAVTQAVRAGSSTALTSSAIPAKLTTGTTSVTYTASVSSSAGGMPSGAVTFKDGATAIDSCATVALANGSASCTVTYSTLGTHGITAVYGGDATYDGSSGSFSQRVVNGAVVGIMFTGVTVDNASRSCPAFTSSPYSCTVAGGSNNATLKANVVFVNASGAPTVYMPDSTPVTVTLTGKNGVAGPFAIAGGQTTMAPTAQVDRQGSNAAGIQAVVTDGTSTFSAMLTTN